MASLDTLPPDQRAVLEMVLRRGRTYDQIAQMLSIDRAGVRDRALAAFDALGPQSGVSPERRHLITDYLLGALPPRVAEEVHSHLAEAPAERAWARVIASELEPVARDPLPEIPLEGGGRVRDAPAAAAADAKPARSRAKAPAAAAAGAGAGAGAGKAERPSGRRERPARSTRPSRPASRAGGAVLLALGAAVVIVVVLVLVLSGGSSKHHTTASQPATHPATTPSTTPATPTTPTTSKNGTQIVAQINLNSPPGASGSAKGIAEVLRSAGKTGIAIVAQGLTPNTTKPPNAYAVWLYNSPTDSRILGFVNPGVGKNGRLQTAGGLPTDASHFHQLLVTLENKSNPKSPGAIVLEGTLTGVS